MKFARSLSSPVCFLTGAMAAVANLSAQESPYDLEKSGWYVRAGGYIQTGVSVSVSRVIPVPPVTSGIYDNGFVQPDISQGAQGLTWNWGYLNESQLVDGKLALSRIEGMNRLNGLNGFGDETLFGPEILVGFQFYQFQIKHHDARFGFELGFRYATSSGSDQATAESDVLLKQDRYDLGGVVAPLPPYIGFPNVAGPLISLTPEPQPTLSARGTDSLSTQLSADFYTARFGAWLSVQITDKFWAGASGGFTSIYAYGRADFTEIRTYDNPAFAPVTQTASESNGDWLPGGYLQLRATYWFRPWISAYLTAEWAYNGSMVVDGLDFQAQYKFGSTLGASAGVQFSF